MKKIDLIDLAILGGIDFMKEKFEAEFDLRFNNFSDRCGLTYSIITDEQASFIKLKYPDLTIQKYEI